MARYRDEFDDQEMYQRDRRIGREAPWGFDESAERRRREFIQGNRPEFSRGRFGERAEYDNDEPRYSDYRGREFRDEGFRESDRGRVYDPGYGRRGFEQRAYDQRESTQYARSRSRLRCREIMTRDLIVAVRDTPLTEVAKMMKQEDTGVIPVVEYPGNGGNGRSVTRDETRYDDRSYGRGKLIGLITDRDIVIRAVAADKDCALTRAEEIMTTDIHMVRPNDRVVDVIRKMGDKQVRRIPIVGEEDRLLGMISMRDIAVETEADQELAEALEDISKGSSFWKQIFG